MEVEGIFVSEHYYWLNSSGEFYDLRSNQSFSDSSFDAKVSVFEDRELSWFLNVSKDLLARGSSPADYVALSVAIAYIEGIEQYRRGKPTPDGLSGNWFKASARRIFPEATSDTLTHLWKEVRCGLFHSGFTNGKTYLDLRLDAPLKLSEEKLLVINPQKFVDGVLEDFRHYIQELRKNPTGALGRKFLELWNLRWDKS